MVDFTEPIDPKRLADRLDGRLPTGIRVTRVTAMAQASRSAPRRVRYRVAIDKTEREAMKGRAERMLRFESIPYERFVHKTGRHRLIDLRPYLETIEVAESSVSFTLYVTDGGSIKPAEVCKAMGIGDDSVNSLVERTEVVWQTNCRVTH